MVLIRRFYGHFCPTGTHYIVELADQTGAQWRLPIRYSQFEKLHNSLEEGTWSAEQPSDPPFPPKQMFPNVRQLRVVVFWFFLVFWFGQSF